MAKSFFESIFNSQSANQNTNNTEYRHYVNPRKKIKKLPLLIIYIIILSLYFYFSTPVLNPIYQENYFFILINVLILLYFIIPSTKNRNILTKTLSTVAIVGIIIYLIIMLLSSPVINSQKYQNLIGDVKTVNYKDTKPSNGEDKIPIVDYALANKLGDKVLGTDVGLGSQYKIGDYYMVSTNNDIAWVAPLEPQSFLKWLQNKKGSPGYIYVSATNPNDVRLVQELNGKPINLKYTANSYFNSNIKRHAYLLGNITKGMTDFSFEIDDDGNPYWVISTYKPTIGFSGNDISGIIVVNAQTGTTSFHSINDPNLPKWINRIYPKTLIENQIHDYGYYTKGWLNTVTTQSNMIVPTESSSYFFNNGLPYFYTGMTSVQNDESTVGFMITNIQTKETIFYKVNGATETAAQKSAEGKVQQYNYLASSPILLDVFKTPSYFTPLKDKDGLVKQYAFISVENYNIVGIGDTVASAKNDYYDQLSTNNKLDTEVIDSKKTKGKIERINFNNGKYYLKLNDSQLLFIIDPKLSTLLPLSLKDDNVTIEYIETLSEYQNAVTFENNDLATK